MLISQNIPGIFNIQYSIFIDKLQIVLKSLLTCKIHKSALEYSIIRRYTNVVYYYYYYYIAIPTLYKTDILLSKHAHKGVQLLIPHPST